MSIYTKKGDSGKTSLMDGISVSKSDDRIELLGTIDELNSSIGLAKVIADHPLYDDLARRQQELLQMMNGIADPRNPDHRFTKEETLTLEEGIDHMESLFPRIKDFVLYGGCEQSARLDMARAVARRAERRFRKAALKYGADPKAMQYLNRLSDYLYVAARYADYLFSVPEPESP
ncbi:cob(I)yrinic acid a,c-diamide adenosyltransferase [Schaedlerella arabinosiphila]|jgi:cob(I)alamin adenosyltransferase|uniref:Corrinoid adenosyltransferase n=1 Tax=Schaedlerella arabinosiphila TaxID=2044587 RepID=N2AG12_9FIRM|nr:cob(I)yrinic acid a,c-diamide adenosyltransferase [Schaedlerella arabinosiphila]MCI9633884.1 cob(I)yrinic acid a,c-diamide adenosyltransferase [Ruminococcus sp.]KAI4442879.1 Corrinoid adenosyltransferase [Schaedlerella arabinosiphila]MDE7066605.1 cob(I)yrinic acid a,c-diamide adenosyltransferase [Schaedlerella arabinosiphila]NDO70244.1 cob(I)yrinic acid a,c-diamide adenosyltransferase [Schaedlerella arabinosiphila]RRK32942.1 cob(I)yrinic acid a,c-diamide adenosyltransferase [Schaedlerella a